MKKSVLLFAMGVAVHAASVAQDKVETSIAADVVNQYIWRGQELGNASLQPTFGIACKGLSLSGWGSIGLSQPDDTKEFDLTLSYSIGGLNVGVTDYWFSVGLDPQNRYFKYDAHGTNHIFEANVGYDFGCAAIQWYTNFAGNDGRNTEGKRAYSSYVELSAPFRFGGAEWTAAVGAVPFATDLYGTDGFAVTNVSLKATKSITITDKFSLPLFAGIATNPCSQKAYLLIGFTLQP